MTISTGWLLDGGALKHHRFMPSGIARCGMFVLGFDGAYVQVLIRPVVLLTGCRPSITKSWILDAVQMNREVDNVDVSEKV